MMNKEIILFLNSLEEEQAINIIKKFPNRSEYSFIFSHLSNEQIKRLSQLINMKIYKISYDTLFQHESIYYFNRHNYKLNDLINTLISFQNIHVYIIITSLETAKKVNIKKTNNITIIIDKSIENFSGLNLLKIDYRFDIYGITNFFIKDNSINNILNNLNKKYHFTYEENKYIKQSLHKINNENKLLKNIVENINQIIIYTDKYANIIYVNNFCTKTTDYNFNEIKGKNLKQLFNNNNLIKNYEKIISTLQKGKKYQLIISDNENYHLQLNFTPIMKNNSLSNILINLTDISDIKDYSNKDATTGVWNRKYFTNKLKNHLINEKNSNFALFLMDLSNLKEINDLLGHDVGDFVLRSIADRINTKLGPKNYLSRFYCDEFIFIMPKINNNSSIINKIQEIINEINKPLIVKNHTLYLKLHFGLAQYPDDGNTVDNLLNNAEVALYTAKKNNLLYLFYDNSMRTSILNKLEIENKIHNAIKNQEFILYYQPIVDINTGNITSIETLLRWHSKEKGILTPNYFLDYIEKTGHITIIGEYTMKDALCKFPYIQNNIQNPLHISFNLSPKQLLNDTLIQNFINIIEETKFNPKNIMFEITENITVESIKNTTNIFNYLSNLGVSFSMDDFGTGYSSLGQLKNYPINKVKIDKILINKMEKDKDYQTILRGIIKLAHSMNYKVVAEGVETKRQLELLKEFQCDEIQGYYICKPIPFEELAIVLKNNQGSFKSLINNKKEE